MTRIVAPATIEEACAVLGDADGEAAVLAGGTALQMLRRRGDFPFATLVDLRRIEGLDSIEPGDGGLVIGARVTHRRVELDPLVHELAPVLADVVSQIANVRVRNAATIGGNLAHRDHRLDPPGALLVLDARLDIASRAGLRTIPVAELFTGFASRTLAPDDVLLRIRVPRPPAGAQLAFTKVKSLGANDWPCASVAAMAVAEGDDHDAGGGPARLELGLTAVAPSPVHRRIDVAGLRLAEVLDRADAAVQASIDPVADLRGGAAFKRRVTRTIVADTVRRLWEARRR